MHLLLGKLKQKLHLTNTQVVLITCQHGSQCSTNPPPLGFARGPGIRLCYPQFPNKGRRGKGLTAGHTVSNGRAGVPTPSARLKPGCRVKSSYPSISVPFLPPIHPPSLIVTMQGWLCAARSPLPHEALGSQPSSSPCPHRTHHNQA